MKYISLLTSFICLCFTLCDAAAVASPLSEGRWVKISVDSMGLYQVTHSRLRDLGFSDPERVRVYGYPASELADHDIDSAPAGLPELASVHASGKLLFYAEAGVKFSYAQPSADNLFWAVERERNPASATGCYFLSDAAPAAGAGAAVVPAASVSQASGGVSRTSHVSVTFMEDEIAAPAGGGTFFVGHELKDGKSPDYRVDIVDPASDRISFQVAAAVRNLKSSQNNYLTLEFPDGDFEAAADDCFTSAIRVQSIYERLRPCRNVVVASMREAVSAGSVSCRFRAIPSSPSKGADFTFAAVDYLVVSYDRRNDMSRVPALDMILYGVEAGESVALTGATSGTMVWNVADLHRVKSYRLSADGTFSIPDAADAVHLVAFDPAAEQREPQISPVPVAGRNLAAMACPDAVILTNACFADKAAVLAGLHGRCQGLDVAVVDQQDVFNEFSSGTPHVMAVRRFLRHLADSGRGRLRGLIIYGAGTIYQASQLSPDGIFVITAENEDAGDGTSMSSNSHDRYGNYDMTRSFATDTYFGRLDDFVPDTRFNSPFFRVLASPLSVMVGRIPVTSLSQADDYNAKVRQYLENPPLVAAPNNALFMSGFARRTEEMHMADAERMAAIGAAAYGPALTVHRAAHNMFGTGTTDTRAISALVASTLRRGVGFMTYFGHGNSVGLTGVWNLTDVNKTNYSHSFPLAMLGSCDVAAFDVDLNSLSTAMLLSSSGGVIGLVAAGREVYQTLNADFGEEFAKSYFSMADGDALGSAFVASFNGQIAGHDKARMCNVLAYNYFGDPLLPYYGLSRQISVSAVNGGGHTIVPGGINTFEGSVTKADGSVDTGFNGTVKIAVYDHPYTAVNRAPNVSSGVKPSTITEIELDQEQLTELVGSVTSGRFTVQGHVPPAQREGLTSRVTLYAFSSDKKVRAGGAVADMTMDYDATPVTGDFAEPAITSFTIEGCDPDSNQVLHGNSARVCAQISAPAGMSLGGNFCTSVRLLRDGALCADAASGLVATASGLYSLSFDVEIPSDGRHELTLIVTDALQRQASASVEFSSVMPLTCSLTADVADSGVIFTTDATAGNSTLFIEDFAGRTVRVISSDGAGNPMEWDLLDAAGKRAAAGHYRAFVRTISAGSCYSSAPVDVVIR